MNNKEIKNFIIDHKHLFWWIKEESIRNISLNLLVEAILNYGNEQDVKQLFNLVGIKKVANIFNNQISKKRMNYSQRTVNFFKLYFNKHA